MRFSRWHHPPILASECRAPSLCASGRDHRGVFELTIAWLRPCCTLLWMQSTDVLRSITAAMRAAVARWHEQLDWRGYYGGLARRWPLRVGRDAAVPGRPGP